MIKTSLQNLVCVLLLALCARSALAEEHVIWKIGAFDHSSNEFRSQGVDYSNPKDDPVYRVGQSQDAQDWQRFQPGPANGMAGGREHPFTVLFELPAAPRGVYRLKIAILYETPRLSSLRVEINGKAGLFYFHPQLDYNAGDWEGTFVPQTSADTKTITIPAQWLKRGENRLVLTALDDPAAPENSFGAIALGHSGLVYDALELSEDRTARYDGNDVEATVIPAIFYRSTKTGLAEVVEVYAGFAAMPLKGNVRLTLAGKSFDHEFSSTLAFGEQRLDFEVPEWTGVEHGSLRIGSKSFPVELTAAKKWTVFIVPHEHLDIGFTDYPEKVAELHSQSVDGVMQILDRIPEFRWTLDGEWVAEKYIAGRSEVKKDELLRRMREGKIVLPPQYANQHTGTASLEGLTRSLYPSHAFARQNELPPATTAHITDVPSYSWSYASVLADAGIKYFVAASNGWRAPVLLLGKWNEKSPFYWEGPDGGRVLMWYSRAYLQLGTLFATPPRTSAVHDSLPVFLQAYSRPEYRANAAIIFGTQLENTPLGKEQSELPGEWAKLYAWPRLEFSTFGDAMQRIEKQFDGHIATYRGDFGPYWEDGFGSDSAATAIHRQNQQRILSAEKLGTLPAVGNPDLRPDQGLLKNAWRNVLLFDEHTWTYVGATTQPENEQTKDQLALKESRAASARREIAESIHRSWAQLESFLGPKETSIAVFNSLSWARSGLVKLDLQDGYGLFDSVTGKLVPVETLQIGKSTRLPGFGGGYRLVRFRAEDVPAVGYKLYAVRASVPPAEPSGISGSTFENRYYRITIDPPSGALRSIWDKELSRELVDANSPYRFGAYIYVTGADDMPHNSLYRFGSSLKPPHLDAVAAGQGRIVSAQQTPLGTKIVLESSAPHTPVVRTEVTLSNSAKRIDFDYQIRKEYVLNKEAVYIAFPFAADRPQFAYETQNGWVDPARDELAGGSREWYAVNHWAAMRDRDWSAAIFPADAPLVNFGDIVRGNWPTEFKPASSTIFSWIMNNYWGTNFAPAQGGDFTFHYSLVSQKGFESGTLTRAGWEALTPLESDQVQATLTPGRLPSDQASLLEVDNPNVALVTWKMAEDGDGSIVRLEEIAGQRQTAKLSSRFLEFLDAWRCSALEDNQAQLETIGGEFQLSLRPFEIVTLRLHVRSKVARKGNRE